MHLHYLDERRLGPGIFTVRANDVTATPEVAQLNWIVGFETSTSSQLELSVAITHCSASIAADQKGNAIVDKVQPTLDCALMALPFHALRDIDSGSYYLLPRGIRTISSYNDQDARSPRSSSFVKLTADFSDSNSAIMPLRELRHAYPELAALILSQGWCPESTGFFVARNGVHACILPCAEILRSCYMPSLPLLRDYIHGKGTDMMSRWIENDVLFSGLSFEKRPKRIYPIRQQRYQTRAEYEMSQLLPRAVVYARCHNGELPIFIRPPFGGNAIVEGNIVKADLRNGGIGSLFISRLTFHSPNHSVSAKPSGLTKMHFAPTFGRFRFALPEIGALSGVASIPHEYDIKRLSTRRLRAHTFMKVDRDDVALGNCAKVSETHGQSSPVASRDFNLTKREMAGTQAPTTTDRPHKTPV